MARRLARVSETGQRPLIIGSKLHEWHEDLDDSASAVLTRGAKLDPHKIFADRLAQSQMDDDEEKVFDFDCMILQDRPDRPPTFTLINGLNRSNSGDPYFCDIPCVNSWEVPAHRNFGGWNDCRSDEEHCAIFKEWHHLCGAEVVGISGTLSNCMFRNRSMTRGSPNR